MSDQAVQLTLDDLAADIHRTWAQTKAHQVAAWDGYFRVGHDLVAARAQHPHKTAYGRWFKAQRFGFSTAWGYRLMTVAKGEADVRDLFVSALTNGDPLPGVDSVFKQLQAGARDADDQAARAIRRGNATNDDGDGFRLILDDLTSADVADESVDLIVTDPPYPVESAGRWDDLATFAKRVLKPGGVVAAMSGKIHLPDRMAALAAELDYGWMYAQELPGDNTRILARHIAQEWKPWLCYSKGPWPSGRIAWHGDLIVDAPRDKSHYHWQQSVDPAELLIRTLAPIDGVVCDPFLGSGSYGIAALNADRLFIGIEIDAGRYQQAHDRLKGWKAA